MHQCHKCNHELTDQEFASGHCEKCGANLSVDAGDLSVDPGDISAEAADNFPRTLDFSIESAAKDSAAAEKHLQVPVFTPQQTQSISSPGVKPGTVDVDGNLSKVSGMTSEEDLPEPLRTVVDPDRTVGMGDEVLPGVVFKATEATDEDGSIHSAGSSAGSAASKSATEASSKQSNARARSTDSTLNVHQRLMSRPGDSTINPELRADYEIIRELGKGGMGVVWLAHQTSLGREVAIKQIKEDSLGKGSDRKIQTARHGFQFEAVVIGNLNHPNIVPVYDMGTDADGNLLYSMKSVTGVSWDRLIETYSESDNVEILRKVSAAIAFAHSRGIVHRDLKPSNIMVGSFDEVLVMDWGTALPLAQFKSPLKGTASNLAGTPAYMAPEQAKGEVANIGTHSDIYLLGAILFEIVAGVPPHPMSNETGGSFTTRQLLENAKANVIVHTDTSGELLEIAIKAMHTSPRDRYASVEKFIEALKNYQKHAESVVMARQAAKDLAKANDSRDYSMYARALYGFENALQLWESNFDASSGLTNARLDYATAALKKENYELGLSLVNIDQPIYKPTYKKLMAGQLERQKRVARLRNLRITAAALLILVFVGGALGGLAINYQWQLAVASEGKAKIARDDAIASEKVAKDAAESEKIAKELAVAKTEEVKAEKIKVEAEKMKAEAAEKEAVAAKEVAETQKALAVTAKDEAVTAQKKAEDAAAKEKIAAEKEKVAKNEAVIAQKKAEDAAEKEKIAAEKEKVAKNEAVTAQKKAEDAAAKEKIAAEKEKLAKDDTLREWYYAQINLADQQVAQNAFDSARKILDEIEKRLSVKGEEQANLAREKGWEFDRLKYVCELAHDKLGDVKADSSVPITAVAAGNQLLATANLRGEIQVWNADTRTLKYDIKTKDQFSALALSSDGATLAAGNSNGQITIWDMESGKTTGVLSRPKDSIQDQKDGFVTRLMFLPEGPLVSTSRDTTVRVWDVSEKRMLNVLIGHPDEVLSLARVADQTGATVGLVTGDANGGEVRYWKWPIGKSAQSRVLLTNEKKSAITALAAQLRGDVLLVFAGSEEGNLKSIESRRTTDGKDRLTVRSLVRQSSDRHQSGISGLLMDPSNPDRLISTSRDNTVRTWNVAQSALADEGRSLVLQVLRGHGNAIVDAAVWKDTKVGAGVTRLLTASADGTARLWRPDESAEIVALGGSTLGRDAGTYGEMLSVSAGGVKGEQIMGVSRDGIATIWNVPKNNAEKIHRISLMEGHRFLTQSAVFLKNVLVTVSFDGTAAVWDTQTGSMVQRWQDVGTTGVLAGSGDGHWVITGYASPNSATDDKSTPPNLQIWSLADALKGGALNEIRTTLSVGQSITHEGKTKPDLDAPATAAVSPNGAWGLVGTENGYLDLIDLKARVLRSKTHAHKGATEPPSPEGVTGVVFLSDTEVVSAGLDGTLRFWTIQDGNIVPHSSRKTYTHADGSVVHRVIALVASADGRRIATRLRQGKFYPDVKKKNSEFAQIWISDIDADGVKPFAKIQKWGTDRVVGDSVSSVSISADGQRVLATVVIPQTTVLREWNFAAGNKIDPKDVRSSAAGSAFSFQQAFYLPGDADHVAVLSDTLTNIHNRVGGGFGAAPQKAYGPTVALQACDVSGDGKLAVTVSDSVVPPDEQPNSKPKLQGEMRIWNVNGSVGRRAGGLILKGAIRTVSMSPVDSNLILVGGYQQGDPPAAGNAAGLYKWDGKELTKIQSLGSHPQGIIRARFSADGKRIVTASRDGQVEVFEQSDAQFASIKLMQLGSDDAKLRLGELVAVDLSSDGKWLAAADKNSAVVIDVATGEPLIDQLIQGHSRDLTDLRFAIRPDAKAPQRLWTCSLDGTAKFWAISENRQPAQKGDAKSPDAVARPLLTLRGHDGGVLSLAALPNGGVVTAGMDGRVILWPVQLELPIAQVVK